MAPRCMPRITCLCFQIAVYFQHISSAFPAIAMPGNARCMTKGSILRFTCAGGCGPRVQRRRAGVWRHHRQLAHHRALLQRDRCHLSFEHNEVMRSHDRGCFLVSCAFDL